MTSYKNIQGFERFKAV